MSFSQFAGTTIVPTLSRIVLALAFISVGHNKLFTHAEFDATQAATLQSLGVTVTPVEADAVSFGDTRIQRALFQSSQQPPETGTAAPSGGPAASPPDSTEPPHIDATDLEDAADEAVDDAAGVEPAVDALPPGTYTARSLYNVALYVKDAGLPQPVYGAWIAALTEFVGGILLLLGLLSRVWGLGLAFAMGVAFYTVTTLKLEVFSALPWEFSQNIPAFNTMYSQLGLGVLALGICLTGPGPLSLDRLFFNRRKVEKDPLSNTAMMASTGPLAASGVPPASMSSAARPKPSEPPTPEPPRRDDDTPPPGRRPL
jgi:uncharacterized membrane protein YphA (DoxX/SURF4 family)